MRKRILVAVLVIGLLSAGIFGGLAYAAGPNAGTPVTYSKLVGTFSTGPQPGDSRYSASCKIMVTNPDSVGNITILSFRVFDANGNKVYEIEELPTDFGPHQSAVIPMEPGYNLPSGFGLYNVEIGWQAKRGTCPLIGQEAQIMGFTDGGTTTLAEIVTFDMVNVEQVLKQRIEHGS